MAPENKDAKWEATFTEELRNITVEQIWPLFEDMASIHKWVPALIDGEKCRIEGNYGEPGLLKYCQFTKQAATMFSDKEDAVWCNVKLLSTDPVEQTMSYGVAENNIGFKSYVGTVKLTNVDGGCKIAWSFISDPMEAMRLEDLKAFIESTLKTVVEGMGAYLSLKSKETKDAKWEYKSTADMKGITAEQLWPLIEDFCTLHKWIPTLDSDKCCHVEGAYGEPGLVRYCVFTEQSSTALSKETDKVTTKWSYEKLLSMDPVKRTLSYEVTENNLGFKYFVGNVKLFEIDEGCKMEWSFMSDSVEGMRSKDLAGLMESTLKTVAEGMRKELLGLVN